MPTARKQVLKNATFRVPKSLWQRAKKRAVDEDRSLNDVVVRALEFYAGAHKDAAAVVLTDADEFVKRRGPNAPARHFTKDELHEDDA
jgi:hypothetical protein